MKISILGITLVLLSVIPAITFKIQNSGQKNIRIISPTPSPLTAPILPVEYSVITETPVPTNTPRPTATPTPTPLPKITSGDLENYFTRYADKESVNRELLKKIAACESSFNPQARNGIYGGMFQFSENSWKNLRLLMNLNTDPELRFNAEEAIKTAAYKLAINGRVAWPNCSK
ncbi:MAG: Protein containing Lytic transglycosylase-like, catalytic-like protein [Candidatus Gottesmanbacteria bacterium GW2011_GWA2_43_14]|uniref:Protein containing Lytic transglycosylase-like, catalytic-like protein n=1 Tax=Candidatus Gottesmanbacteria bacterium GW2011_GWA2_43_14 TaxID=1618443 RepID=A0A0G1DJW7_9BACT|nr:MAG: Protein containing Lytic transglycosylase-like, catalytic-like protein [Candidatus Gottesmanbacteria bacterium GW2011_GWA2_43_14]